GLSAKAEESPLSAAEERRMLSHQVQELKNDRKAGEGRDGLLVLKEVPKDPTYADYAKSVVAKENSAREKLFTEKAEVEGKGEGVCAGVCRTGPGGELPRGMGSDGRGEVEEEVNVSFTFRFRFTDGFESERPRKGKRNRKRTIHRTRNEGLKIDERDLVEEFSRSGGREGGDEGGVAACADGHPGCGAGGADEGGEPAAGAGAAGGGAGVTGAAGAFAGGGRAVEGAESEGKT
ncbi:MAG: hypothetical protein RL549_978, partial [Verrucomicrobiota bacterium]